MFKLLKKLGFAIVPFALGKKSFVPESCRIDVIARPPDVLTDLAAGGVCSFWRIVIEFSGHPEERGQGGLGSRRLYDSVGCIGGPVFQPGVRCLGHLPG